MEPVNFEVWVTKEIEDLKKFVEFWKEGNKTDPLGFPITLHQGDWDEQFAFWQDQNRS